MLVVLGFISYTVAITPFSIFSPILFIGMGYYDDESSASFMFGLIVLVCGTIGTFGGAMALGYMAKGEDVTRDRCAVLLYGHWCSGWACDDTVHG